MLLKSEIFVRYVKRLIVVTSVLCIIAIVYSLLVAKEYLNQYTFHLLGFFFILMVLSHYLSVRLIDGDLQKFIRVYMLTAISRLLIYMAMILLYVFTKPGNSLNFVITFFILYLIFTTFEVREISRTLVKKTKNKNFDNSTGKINE